MFVKICGLRRPVDLEAAVEAGADAIGLVFADSPRRVTAAEAADLMARVPPGIEVVAVFREPEPDRLRAALDLGIGWIQADASWRAPAGVRWLPAFADGADLAERAGHHPTGPGQGLSAAILVDGPVGGGRGVPPDLDRVAALAATRPVILAGGLRPDTVAAAIARVRPFGVDVSSGVESEPGVKDPARVRAFVAAARAAVAGRKPAG